jgi:heat-inducible transcriptional repressor
MYDLTQRQIEILKHIVKEYVDSAEPVGSETLEKKYDLGVSPATIRNEMSEMVRLGYLSKPHTSAGRIPTSKAMRFYVNELMKEKEMSVAEEVEAKEKVWDVRERQGRFLREATKALSQKTKALAVATDDDGDVFYAGYSNILDMPEFYDIDVAKNLLEILDNVAYFDTVYGRIQDQCSVFWGDEFAEEILRPYSFVFSKFETKKKHIGTIGIIGPARLRYEQIVPVVRYYGSLIGDIADW